MRPIATETAHDHESALPGGISLPEEAEALVLVWLVG